MTSVKKDQGKPKLSDLDLDFVYGMAEVMAFGREKYGKDNWKKATDTEPFFDAACRHLIKNYKVNKEAVDSETKLSHLLHLGCNAMIMYYIEKQKLQSEKEEQVSSSLKAGHIYLEKTTPYRMWKIIGKDHLGIFQAWRTGEGTELYTINSFYSNGLCTNDSHIVLDLATEHRPAEEEQPTVSPRDYGLKVGHTYLEMSTGYKVWKVLNKHNDDVLHAVCTTETGGRYSSYFHPNGVCVCNPFMQLDLGTEQRTTEEN